MGKSQNKQIITRAIITCLLLTPILLNEIDNRNKQVLYAAMVYTPIYFLLLFFFIIISIYDFRAFLKTKKIRVFIPSFIGLIIIVSSFTIFKTYQNLHQEKSSFKAFYNRDCSKNDRQQFLIEFKENGNYILSKSTCEEYITFFFYGKYSRNDSIITLDKNYNDFNISNKFKIQNVQKQNFSGKTNKFMLIQLDQNNNPISTGIVFKIKPIKILFKSELSVKPRT